MCAPFDYGCVIYDLGSLAEWLTAFGTILATATALYFSLSQHAERLEFTLYVNAGALDIVVFNTSSKPVILVDAGFEVGLIRPEPEGSVEAILAGRRLPTKLAPGTDFTYTYRISYEPSYLADRLYKLVNERLPWNRTLFFVAVTGSGKRIRQRIGASLREQLVRKAVPLPEVR